MTSYINHSIFNVVILSLLFVFNQEYNIIDINGSLVFFIFFMIGTFIVNPDMDTKSKSSNILGIFSVPYRRFFRHRGMSHHWMYGIITRIIYFTILMIILGSIILFVLKGEQIFNNNNIYYVYDIIIQYLSDNKNNVIIAYNGLFISNLLHIVLDKIT